MNFKHILVVTYGRSGSTLLQGLLNSIDGCLIRGENFNACRGLFMAYDAFRKAREENGDRELSNHPTSPWFGASLLDEDRFLSDAHELVIHQLAPNRLAEEYQCIGFKEVRYLGEIWPQTENAAEDLNNYLEFLSRLLPECALMFLSRDHEQVVGSAWWKGRNPDFLKQRLTFFEDALHTYAQGKPWVFEIAYLDMVEKTPRLHAMFDFLGAPYDEATVNQVLSKRHSFAAAPGKLQKPIERWSDDQNPVMAVKTALETGDGRQPRNQRLRVNIEAAMEIEIPTTLNLAMQDPTGTIAVDWTPAANETHADGYGKPGKQYKIFSRANRLSEGQSATLYLLDGEDNEYCLARIGIGI